MRGDAIFRPARGRSLRTTKKMSAPHILSLILSPEGQDNTAHPQNSLHPRVIAREPSTRSSTPYLKNNLATAQPKTRIETHHHQASPEENPNASHKIAVATEAATLWRG